MLRSGIAETPSDISRLWVVHVHSAITKATDNPEYEIKESIVFANCNIHFEGKIKYLPAYMVMFLSDDISAPILKKLPVQIRSEE